MIQEEYVSFETAKLLKTKEFDFPCMHVYQDNGNFISLHALCGWRYACNSELVAEYSAPTQALAMRWLREMHNLYIVAEPDTCYEHCFYGTIYYKGEDCYTEQSDYAPDGVDTPEEACEAAIKYCLENLI